MYVPWRTPESLATHNGSVASKSSVKTGRAQKDCGGPDEKAWVGVTHGTNDTCFCLEWCLCPAPVSPSPSSRPANCPVCLGTWCPPRGRPPRGWSSDRKECPSQSQSECGCGMSLPHWTWSSSCRLGGREKEREVSKSSVLYVTFLSILSPKPIKVAKHLPTITDRPIWSGSSAIRSSTMGQLSQQQQCQTKFNIGVFFLLEPQTEHTSKMAWFSWACGIKPL